MNPADILHIAALLLAFVFIISITIHIIIIVYSKSKLRPYILFVGLPIYTMLWGIAFWYMTVLSLTIVMLSLLLIKRDGVNIGKELFSKIFGLLLGIVFLSLFIILGAFLKGLSAWIDNLYADIFSNLFF
ncbi:hypothetical protein RHO14_04685 [Orbus wheelerorum]|uniref:hypothetical protein n=1 Tax=Orbus wheelerorum TaxID=3074111 RepID=UPI00370CFD80